MRTRNRLAAIVGAGLLALPLSACAEDEPDVVIDEEETSEVVPEDNGETGGDTGGDTSGGEGETGGETGGDTSGEGDTGTDGGMEEESP